MAPLLLDARTWSRAGDLASPSHAEAMLLVAEILALLDELAEDL
jgi:hypothetical protein